MFRGPGIEPWMFGSGFEGDKTYSGSDTQNGSAMYNKIMAASSVVSMTPWKLYASTSIDVGNGEMQANGTNAGGVNLDDRGSPGTISFLGGGDFIGGAYGGSGQTSGGEDGGDFSAVTTLVLGGTGGDGTDGSDNVKGVGGAAEFQVPSGGDPLSKELVMSNLFNSFNMGAMIVDPGSNGKMTHFAGGCGGGGGGTGDGGEKGGGGGGGGGIIWLASPLITVASGGKITANGGKGSIGRPPGASGFPGVGGGGGGGAIVLICGKLVNNGTIECVGGAGGTDTPNPAGQDGGDGMVVVITPGGITFASQSLPTGTYE